MNVKSWDVVMVLPQAGLLGCYTHICIAVMYLSLSNPTHHSYHIVMVYAERIDCKVRDGDIQLVTAS